MCTWDYKRVYVQDEYNSNWFAMCVPGTINVFMYRMSTMSTGLQCVYPGVSSEAFSNILEGIQKSIRQKVSFFYYFYFYSHTKKVITKKEIRNNITTFPLSDLLFLCSFVFEYAFMHYSF